MSVTVLPTARRLAIGVQRHLASLAGAQASALAHLCGALGAGSVLTVETVAADGADRTITFTTQTRVALDGPVPAERPVGASFAVDHRQAPALAMLCRPRGRAVERLDVFAAPPHEPVGTLLIELQAGQPCASSWLLRPGGGAAPPIAHVGMVVFGRHDAPEIQAGRALAELYRFAPLAATAARPQLEAAQRDAPGLDATDRAELFGSLARQLLRTLDGRHPFRTMTCRADVLDEHGQPAIGWGIGEEPQLAVVHDGRPTPAA